jgi:hypothetical protein
MRTSIASLTLMTGLCVFATNGSAATYPVQCPETSSIQCETPVSVSGLYKTTCSSGEWKGQINSEDKNFVPKFDGSPHVSMPGFPETPACNYPIKSPNEGTTEYIMLLNVSLVNQGCKVSGDRKEFNCSGS